MEKFRTLILVPLLLAIAGCMGEIDPEEALTGRWKLVRGQTFFLEPRTVDYSSNEIVYHFHKDGDLTISSDLEDPIGYPEGQYFYEFRPFPAFDGHNLEYTLQIGGASWACAISRNRMTLDNSPLDGPILTFVKI